MILVMVRGQREREKEERVLKGVEEIVECSVKLITRRRVKLRRGTRVCKKGREGEWCLTDRWKATRGKKEGSKIRKV